MVEQCYEWAEYHERIKYNLVRNILYAFSIVMLMLGIFNLTSNKMDGLPNLFAAAVCISGIILLHKSNNYKLVALFISATSLIIVGIAFFISNGSNLLTPYWMLVNVIFSFYMIGKIVGSFVLVIHFITYFIYQKYFYDTNVVLFSSFKTIDYVTYLLEFSAIGFSIIYLLVIFSKAASLSEKDFKKINNHLTKQNVVISKQNTEMELMLKEIHHRVKNNMQIISSLLRLEANRATEKSGAFYQEAIDRISAMALVHEKMYKTGALSKFDLEKYIESLVKNLISNYSTEQKPGYTIEVSMESLQSKSIVPFALLLNELLLNSLKHAFSNQNNPHIYISVSKNPSLHKDLFDLKYSDNGSWNKNAEPSFGSEIIEAMVAQLEGEIAFETGENGTEYSFTLANMH